MWGGGEIIWLVLHQYDNLWKQYSLNFCSCLPPYSHKLSSVDLKWVIMNWEKEKSYAYARES
jgi:hypothetical protein